MYRCPFSDFAGYQSGRVGSCVGVCMCGCVHEWLGKEISMSMPNLLLPGEAVRARIDELRAEYHISYRRLAMGSGVPYSTVKSYLHGDARDITLGTLVSLANYFGMTLREFTDSDVFDIIDVSAVRRRRPLDGEEDLKDFRELRNKSEEYLLWNEK